VIDTSTNEESKDMDAIKQLKALIADKRAVTALEYGMIAALVAVVAITAFSTLGSALSATVNTVAQSLQ
jgi:pilus assembly protein Flp/PilA